MICVAWQTPSRANPSCYFTSRERQVSAEQQLHTSTQHLKHRAITSKASNVELFWESIGSRTSSSALWKWFLISGIITTLADIIAWRHSAPSWQVARGFMPERLERAPIKNCSPRAHFSAMTLTICSGTQCALHGRCRQWVANSSFLQREQTSKGIGP